MSQGRVSAKCAALVAAVPLCLLLVYALNVDAATYTVGDSAGWSFKVASWPKGKRFRAGDTLIFKYDPTLHNVVAVNRASYKSCTTAAGAKVYSSGNDPIKLVKGQNFFICNTAGHCGSGMKIAINAM